MLHPRDILHGQALPPAITLDITPNRRSRSLIATARSTASLPASQPSRSGSGLRLGFCAVWHAGDRMGVLCDAGVHIQPVRLGVSHLGVYLGVSHLGVSHLGAGEALTLARVNQLQLPSPSPWPHPGAGRGGRGADAGSPWPG